ncbi:MAG: PQQ-binding-like beta-propeller repeat protein [Acidimicrobiia bacterium]|nr:PQQ-binding-like beta-propeller repeat protein [Acidimicrobiia bacterium]
MPRHAAPPHHHRRLTIAVVATVVVLGLGGAWAADGGEPDGPPTAAAFGDGAVVATTTTGDADVEGDDDEGSEEAEDGPSSGFATPGLLTFRGSPTRSYYGEGPVPSAPEELWSYPGESGGMCAQSSGRQWCGSGWTGQPSVFESDMGGVERTWVVFGAYDTAVHFVDYDTGEDILPPFPTGDIIKGSVSVDPDGFPLVYSGSRDNEFHILAIDRPEATELWALDAEAVSPTLWNDDWDGSGLIVDDYLYIGGENSQFHVVKLNRGYDDAGLVTVDPELVFNAPGWDDQLLADIGDDEVSIENSPAMFDDVVYFANSGGLVQGWDVSGIPDGEPAERVFRFWMGEDVDASVVIDDEGMLYVAAEFEHNTPSRQARAEVVGQLVKLDPSRPDDPVVWSVANQESTPDAGFWATPAIAGDMLYIADNAGELYGIDRMTGEEVWQISLAGPTWQSPVVVDDVLIEGDCDGILRGFDVSDPTVEPPELWSVSVGGCIESTPALWEGRFFFGTRAGRFHAVGDPVAAPADD